MSRYSAIFHFAAEGMWLIGLGTAIVAIGLGGVYFLLARNLMHAEGEVLSNRQVDVMRMRRGELAVVGTYYLPTVRYTVFWLVPFRFGFAAFVFMAVGTWGQHKLNKKR